MVLAGIKVNFFNIVAAPTLIGLGVDGGTHIYHRYKELGPGSIPYILRNTGWSSFLVALTASMGYVSLLGAEHRGIKSLGVLTLIAIGANLFTTFVLLPAILQWREDRRARRG
jgi:predicted RND superfamily exporter protein